jgi:hypothetical protein
MRKLATLVFILLLSVAAGRLHAQSLKNTAWKFYVDALHDTLTFHIGADSSFTTTSTGETVIRSSLKVEKDTLKIMDVDGQYFCGDGEGVYKWSVEGDLLSFFLVKDPCANRADVLNGIKCRRTASK